MTEPKRWLESDATSAELKELLGSAPRPTAIPGSVRNRVLGRLTALAPAVTIFGLSLKAAATTFVASAVVSSVAIVGVREWQTSATKATSVLQPPKPSARAGGTGDATTRAGSQAATNASEPSATTEVPTASFGAESSPESSARPAKTKTNRAPEVPSGVEQPPRDGLARETALLESARGSLQSAPAAALAATRRHAAEFPGGQLRAERMFIEAEALRRLGRTEQARRTAEQALSQYPGGLYAERVSAFLDGLK